LKQPHPPDLATGMVPYSFQRALWPLQRPRCGRQLEEEGVALSLALPLPVPCARSAGPDPLGPVCKRAGAWPCFRLSSGMGLLALSWPPVQRKASRAERDGRSERPHAARRQRFSTKSALEAGW